MYMLKFGMARCNLPAEEDYWKSGSSGGVVFLDYGMYMTHRRFQEWKSFARFSSYDLSV